MSKDKLISLIIRKQTYKDTKPYLTDLLNLKEQSVKYSIQAIKEILTTDYNAEAKLYAVRYMKDAFEKANPSFINLVEKELLPLLINISIDQNDEKSVMKYAGSSYTKSDQLSKFKAIVSSLFRMVKECIIKWAEWIPDQDRKFIHALNEIKKKKVDLNFQWKYFRPQNEQLFFQCCQKNGLKLGANTAPAATAKAQEKPSKKAKDPLVVAIQQSLAKVKEVEDQKQLQKVENDFNEAINNYLENSSNFQEVFVQQSFEQFQQSKAQALKRIRHSTKKIKQPAAAESISKQKSVKKLESSANKAREQSKPEMSTSVQKIEQPPAQTKVQKNNPKQDVKITSDQNLNKVTAIKSDQIIKESISKKEIQVKKQVKELSKKPQSMLQHQLKEQVQKQISEKTKEVKTKPKIIAQQLQQKQVVTESFKKPVQKSKQVESKELKVPTSPKRGPIKFEQESQSPFSSKQASNVKEDPRVVFSKPSVKESSAFKSKNDVSQQSQRVDFSDEQSSQHSQDGHHRFQPRDFKKKVALTPIKQETFRSPAEEKSIKGSRIGQEQSSFTNREKKGGATHKLMEENRLLSDKYDMLWKQFEAQKKERQNLLKEKQALQKELRLKAESEERLIKKLKGSVPIEDYNKLRQQLQQEKQKKQNLMRQNLKIRSQHHSLIEQLNETKYRLKNSHQEEKPKTKIKEAKVSEPVEVIKPILSAPVIKEELDQDYVKNLTHISNLRRWLNKSNLFLFKKNVLSISQIAYRDDYLCILSKSSVYTQNNQQFLSMTLTFQFKSLKQVRPHVRYVNCQELDIWSKPLTGQGDLYTQQLAVRLHSNPLKVIKAEVKVIEVIDITFLLPAIYLNFLREQEFSNNQFEEIFAIKSEQLLKSKITQWNKQIIKQAADIQRLFKNSVLLDDKLRLCLSQGINDQIFMAQFQILRNNKFLLRVLPIPYSEGMIVKGKQLIENIVFLLS